MGQDIADRMGLGMGEDMKQNEGNIIALFSPTHPYPSLSHPPPHHGDQTHE
jgi:hypothetical protein